jgi:DME family drug/metabolite transporter
MAAYQPLFFSGIDRAGVAVGTVVGIGTVPVAGGLLGRVVRGEHLGRRWWLATALGLTGATLLGVAGNDDAGDHVVSGLLLAAGAGVAYSVYVAASASLLDQREPDDVAAAVLGLAGVVLVPVALASDLDWVSEPGGVALVAWLAVATVAVAYPLLARGLAVVGVGATATLTLAEPATAAFLGIVVVGERLPASGWFGLALVAAGVVVEAVAATNRRGNG